MGASEWERRGWEEHFRAFGVSIGDNFFFSVFVARVCLGCARVCLGCALGAFSG